MALLSRSLPAEATAVQAQASAAATSQPFHEFCAGRLAAPAEVACRLASPPLGRAWAAALVMYWSHLQRRGGLDLHQPLYVLDLAPADGALAQVLLPALAGELRAHGMHDWPVRYLACSPSRAGQLALTRDFAARPLLHGFLEAGLLDSAQWPARTGQPLVHGLDRRALFGARNPVVALALGAWSHQPSQLYAVHHGCLHQGRVRAQPHEREAGAWRLAYDWPRLEAGPGTCTSQALLLSRYLAGIPSAALLLSESALAEVDALADFSGGRYLLLSADLGVADEHQIRGRAMTPPDCVTAGEWLLPVNFHALAEHQCMAGALAAQHQCEDGGWVLHLASRDDNLGVDPCAWEHLVNRLMQAHPGDRERDCVVAQPFIDAADLDHRLRRSGCDPCLLSAALQARGDADIRHDPVSAQALSRSLAAAWVNTDPGLRGAALGCALARLACELGDWGLARRVLAQSEPDGDAQAVQLMHWRAEVEARTGHTEAALQWAQRALQVDSGNVDTQALATALRERLARWLGQRWYAPRHMHSGDLCLELVHEGHHASLRHQMRDPQIAVMSQMKIPAPGEPEEEDGSVDFALMHADRGVVGQIGFRHHNDMAHFHLWIGTDFQGLGLGARAVQALLAVLAAAGVAHAFSIVYRDNQRCRRLLARAGFSEFEDAQGSVEPDWLVVHRATVPAALVDPSVVRQRWGLLCRGLDDNGIPAPGDRDG